MMIKENESLDNCLQVVFVQATEERLCPVYPADLLSQQNRVIGLIIATKKMVTIMEKSEYHVHDNDNGENRKRQE